MPEPTTRQLFDAAFGREAQRQRLEQREQEERERLAFEQLERRRQHFAALRQAAE